MNKIRTLPYRIAVFWWKITKPKTFGARALLIKNESILLVKHSYGPFWYLPGGGLKRGETYEEALKREMKEELNAEIFSLKLLGVYNSTFEGKNDSM
jgi:ADP-ribose pyrophosphatase YjhB (NUDIX family)